MSVSTSLRSAYRKVVSPRPYQLRSRVVVKTVLYRAVMVLVTIAIAFVFTGNVGQALSIGVATNVVKTGTYYAYERTWDRVSWGLETDVGSGR